MTLKSFSNHERLADAPLAPHGEVNQTAIDFMPCPEDVAKNAYLTYVSAGAPQGFAVQHWLEAETRLIQEHGRTLVRGLLNRNKKSKTPS